jgi:hypothetical protein
VASIKTAAIDGPIPERFMTGSRTAGRGLRMVRKTDMKAADKLMTDALSRKIEDAKTMRSKE